MSDPPKAPSTHAIGPAGPARPPAGGLALTHAQLDAWLLHHAGEETAICNEGLALQLSGSLDEAALTAALQELLRRHPALGTRVSGDPALPTASLAAPGLLPIARVDLLHLPPAERAAERQRLLREAVERRFAPDHPPMLRATLIREGLREHTLALCAHHLAADAWSLLRLLPRDLLAWYGHRLAPGSSPPALSRVAYADFAAWEAQQIGGADAAEHLSFWRHRLADVPTHLDLPFAPRAAEHGTAHRGARVKRRLGAERAEALRALATRESVAEEDLLMAVWAVVLGRLAEQSEFVIGTPIPNRRKAEFEGLVGCLGNTVPVRVSLDADMSLADVARQLAEEQRAMAPHVGLPSRVIAQSAGARAQGGRHLYRVLFHDVPLDPAPPSAAGLVAHAERIDPVGAVGDLSLEVQREPGLSLGLEYRAHLLSDFSARGILNAVVAALDHALAEPGTPQTRLGLLDSADLAQLEDWSGTDRHDTDLAPVHARVLRTAALRPGAEAFVAGYGEPGCTYAELASRVRALAGWMASRGIGRGQRVALWIESPALAVQALLATMVAGAAYVPINTRFPPQRVEAMLVDSGAVLLIADAALAATLAPRLDVVCADALPGLLAASTALEAPVPVTPQDPVYVMYTSGSTGAPKGVVVSHGNLAHQLFARQLAYDLPPQCFILLYSLSFDSSVAGLFWSLVEGGRLVLPDEEARRDPQAICEAVARHGVTHLDSVPALHGAILSAAQPGQLDGLRLAVVGGEATPRSLVDLHHRLLPQVRLFNEYGPTEATVFATVAELARDAPGDSVPIGRPIAGTRCHVLDRRREPVPVGLPGELWISGPGVAQGYLGREAETAERFLPDPTARDGGRMYRTGDRVRWRPDGQLEFLGRVDRQVKVRGYRIELEEIQATLGALPGVQEAAVVLRDPHGDNARIAAYVVPATGAVLEPQALRLLLAQRLPEAMVPTEIGLVAQLARTPNGKLDLAALPDLRSDGGTARVPMLPRTDVERRLTALYERLLRASKIGIDDDFFALGGHSLLAVQLTRAVQQDMGLACTLRTLFEAPTVRELAARLQDTPVLENNRAFPLQQLGEGPPIFCVCGVFLYQDLADHLKPETPVYGVFLPMEEAMYSQLDLPDAQALTVEAMATEYLRVVRAQQPYGPYRLAGLSFGGLLAYEMAQQLRRQGEPVELLVLMDTLLPQLVQPNAMLRTARRWAKAVLQAVTRPWRERFGRHLPGDPVLDADVLERERLDDARQRAYERAMDLYRPRPYAGVTLLMRALDALPGTKAPRNPTYGWDAMVSKLFTYVVPGDHLGILDRPNVDQLAAYIKAHLGR